MFYLLDYKISQSAVIADSSDFSIEILGWKDFETAVQQGLIIQGVSIKLSKAGKRSVHLTRCNLPMVSGRDTVEYYAQLGFPAFVIERIISNSEGLYSVGRFLKFPQIDYKDFLADNSLRFLTRNGELLTNDAALSTNSSLVTNCIPAFSVCNKSIYLVSGKEHAMKISTLVSGGSKSLLVTPSRGTDWTTIFDKRQNEPFISMVKYAWQTGVFDPTFI